MGKQGVPAGTEIKDVGEEKRFKGLVFAPDEEGQVLAGGGYRVEKPEQVGQMVRVEREVYAGVGNRGAFFMPRSNSRTSATVFSVPATLKVIMLP